jgi:glycosyltransferase involved in cell wall biosynthesis
MRVIIATEHRFARDLEGRVYSLTGGREYYFWTRYLSAFDKVVVLARVQPETFGLSSDSAASGPHVDFYDLPATRTFIDYLTFGYRLRRRIAELDLNNAACILRVPGHIGSFLGGLLRKKNYPYAVEVVGDPYDVFAPQANNHPLRPFIRSWSSRNLRQLCASAVAATYVTAKMLQKRYPPNPEAFITYYSDVELKYVDTHRYFNVSKQQYTLINVGTMAQLYKAQDILIQALSICITRGLDLRLVLVGGGKHQPELEALVTSFGLDVRVDFCGQLTAGEAVRRQLDQADLFVMPSRQEGLPRAMIEAMARGLPCIGTNVGGISELLSPDCLVAPNDPYALAEKIIAFISNPDRLTKASARNLQKAYEYHDDILRQRREEFYKQVRKITEIWHPLN